MAMNSFLAINKGFSASLKSTMRLSGRAAQQSSIAESCQHHHITIIVLRRVVVFVVVIKIVVPHFIKRGLVADRRFCHFTVVLLLFLRTRMNF